MVQQFLKEKKVIKICKKCGVEFRPVRGSYQDRLGLCYPHRQEWLREQGVLYKEARKKYYETHKELIYENWKKWVARNLPRRRQLSLEYNKRHRYAINKRRRMAKWKNWKNPEV